jgi:CubicO group peptidase (beta-lactamase class C family)
MNLDFISAILGSKQNAYTEGQCMRKELTTAMVLILLASFPRAYGNRELTSREDDVERIFQGLTDNQSPGFAVLVRENGRTAFERGYGVRDLRSRRAIDSHTNFRLASCTKQFTAMAIMLLVHDGKLRYEERLTDVFPEFPDYGRAITIRNLLNHTSGLPDYESLMEEASNGRVQWSEDHQIHDGDVLRLLEAQKIGKFSPGTQWSYSNSGYVVLGLIVAKASGESFPEFLHDRIFGPLGMNHTVAFVNGRNQVPDRAYGFSRDGDRFVQTDQSATSATLGDGGVYSNLEDLSKWDDGLAHHTLLTASEMQPALTPAKVPDGSIPNWASDPGDADPQAGKPVLYGFGWFLDDYQGERRMWHYGETTGFRTAIERFTKNNLTIVILSNRSDLDPGPLALRVADLYYTTRH